MLAAATATAQVAQVAQQGAKLSASQTEAFTKALATERTGAGCRVTARSKPAGRRGAWQ